MEDWEGGEFEFERKPSDDRKELFLVSEECCFDSIHIGFLEIDFVFSGKIRYDKLISLEFSATSGASIERLKEEFTRFTTGVHRLDKYLSYEL
jgi:hypothetical protein